MTLGKPYRKGRDKVFDRARRVHAQHPVNYFCFFTDASGEVLDVASSPALVGLATKEWVDIYNVAKAVVVQSNLQKRLFLNTGGEKTTIEGLVSRLPLPDLQTLVSLTLDAVVKSRSRKYPTATVGKRVEVEKEFRADQGNAFYPPDVAYKPAKEMTAVECGKVLDALCRAFSFVSLTKFIHKWRVDAVSFAAFEAAYKNCQPTLVEDHDDVADEVPFINHNGKVFFGSRVSRRQLELPEVQVQLYKVSGKVHASLAAEGKDWDVPMWELYNVVMERGGFNKVFSDETLTRDVLSRLGLPSIGSGMRQKVRKLWKKKLLPLCGEVHVTAVVDVATATAGTEARDTQQPMEVTETCALEETDLRVPEAIEEETRATVEGSERCGSGALQASARDHGGGSFFGVLGSPLAASTAHGELLQGTDKMSWDREGSRKLLDPTIPTPQWWTSSSPVSSLGLGSQTSQPPWSAIGSPISSGVYGPCPMRVKDISNTTTSGYHGNKMGNGMAPESGFTQGSQVSTMSEIGEAGGYLLDTSMAEGHTVPGTSRHGPPCKRRHSCVVPSVVPSVATMCPSVNPNVCPSPPIEVIQQHPRENIRITIHDIGTLAPGRWVNDEVVNYYMAMLQDRQMKRIAEGSWKGPRCHFFSSFFLNKLCVDSGRYNYAAVRRWTVPERVMRTHGVHSILDLDRIILPCHLGTYWTCVVVDMQQGQVVYLDSMKGDNPGLAECLLQFLVDEAMDKQQQTFDVSTWRIDCPKDIPEQPVGNHVDCGIFAMKFADYIGQAKQFDFTVEDMMSFRHGIAFDIGRGFIE